MVLKLGYFGMYIINTLKALKCGDGQGRRRSFGCIVRKMQYYG